MREGEATWGKARRRGLNVEMKEWRLQGRRLRREVGRRKSGKTAMRMIERRPKEVRERRKNKESEE